MSSKRLAYIAILAALCIVLRFAFGAFPNVKPLTAIFLVSMLYLKGIDSFLVMAVTMVGSGLVYGGGTVVIWQLMSYSLIMLFWKGLVVWWAKAAVKNVWLQSVLAGISALAYGFFITIPLSLVYHTPFWGFWLNGVMFDLAHAVSTSFFYPVIYFIFRRLYHEKMVHNP